MKKMIYFAVFAIMMAIGNMNVNAKVNAKHNGYHMNDRGIVEVRYDAHHHEVYAGHRNHRLSKHHHEVVVVDNNVAAGVAGVAAGVAVAAFVSALMK